MSLSLLDRLASSLEKTKLLVIQEHSVCRAKHLFDTFLKQSCCNPAVRTKILLLQTDSSLFDEFGAETVCPLFNQFHDAKFNLKEGIDNFLISCEPEKANRVFIDSLNPLIQLLSSTELSDVLKRLTQTCDSIVTTVFSSALEAQKKAIIRRVATAYASIAYSDGPANELKIHTMFKRKHRTLGFKVEVKEEKIRVEGDKIQVVKETVQKKQSDVSNPSDDLSKVTFNLNLSEKEKSDRNNVQLPYVKYVSGLNSDTSSDSFIFLYFIIQNRYRFTNLLRSG